MLSKLSYISRTTAGTMALLRTPIPADPEQFVRNGMRQRDAAFLEITRRVVFDNPEHPYHRMFQHAGCTAGDLAAGIKRDGLEPTLLRLRREGVYLSQDEWKGRKPIVRAGREIQGATESFKNPLITGGMDNSSSGSTGRPVMSTRSTAAQVHNWVYHLLRLRELGAGRNHAWIDVKPILPFPGGLNHAIGRGRLGIPIDRWFSVGSTFSDYGHYRLLTGGLVLLAKMWGTPTPLPTYLPPNDFSPVAAHIARRRAEGRDCVVHGIASPLARVAGAALDKGYDISGSIFICGGEALTPGKCKVFEQAGVRARSSYTISEIGNIGAACRSMHGNCLHLLEDSVAAIGFPRENPFAGDAPVDSLHFTTLTPYAPNIFINVEMDDAGILEPANCDCMYSRLGFKQRLVEINSFAKLSPQGMTFHVMDLIEVLEQALPARLGGKSGDYQLVECEAQNSQTQLRLLVSPRTGVADCARIREAFLDLMRPRWGGALATRLWDHSEGIEVVIAEPQATRSGKVHPIRLLASSTLLQNSLPTEPTHAG